ncbi:MAG: BCCT family transporter, partial [Bacillota bacterium]|nr:BCCT family transporter [Bacillota bacterium]
MLIPGQKYDKKLFITASAIVFVILGLGIGLPNAFAQATTWLLSNITLYFDSWFIVIVTVLTFIYFAVALSRYGKLKLGLTKDEKEYSNFSWFAMLFSCGIGVGFLFWGIAEPMTHFMVASPHNPYPVGDPAGYSSAMKIAVFHWGLQGWVGYMALGIPIGYFAYRYNLPITTSSSLYGIFGSRLKGGWSFVTDLIAIFATVFGVATTIGMGLMTMSYGIAKIFNITVTNGLLVAIMAALVICYMTSAASGIDRGVRRLSNLNIYLCIALMLFILFMGPTRFQIDLILETTGCYLRDFIYMSFYTGVSGEYQGWVGAWTIFYWCWFLSWGPFVGGFIARISKGRSLRQYIIGSIILPTSFTLIWFCILGGTAMYNEVNGSASIWQVLENNLGAGIFSLLEAFPLTTFFSVVVLISLTLFLITTADSASILCAMMVCKTQEEPSVFMRCYWALLIGAVGTVLL